MNAVNPIDELREAKRLQQALKKNPNDIASLLKIASMLKNQELKRRTLNRILTLDPVNQAARDMLLEMDRAGMGGVQVRRMTPIVPMQGPQPAASILSANDPLESPRVFRYSIWLQSPVYLFIAATMYIALQALQKGDMEVMLVMGAFLVFLFIPVWFISAVLELDSLGVRLSRMMGVARWEFSWEEIEEFRSNVLGQGLKVRTKEGQVVEISAQLGGYPDIVDILQRKRPDLFCAAGASFPAGTGSTGRPKTFQKNWFATYTPLALVILSSLILVGTLVTAQCQIAIPMVVLLFLLWRFILPTPYRLTIEENRLVTRSFRKQQDLTAGQIKEIKMATTYSRWGFARNYVRIRLLDGGSFWLAGFAGGDEPMYGFLKNWWNVYREK